MRTARAQRVRISPSRQRIFVEYGDTVAAFPIPLFLANVADPNLWPVGVMPIGKSPYRYGDPIERVAKPSTFFYAEAPVSGWLPFIGSQDVQDVLSDFDVDDAGHVYVGTLSWGWGIEYDANDFPDVRHMDFRSHVASLIDPHAVIALKVGPVRYTVISASDVASPKKPSLLIYDATNPWLPLLKETRKGKPNGIVRWARYDTTGRLATVGSDGKLRVYTYQAFISGGAPLTVVDPAKRKTFRDLSFDENGTLWVVEATMSVPQLTNRLLRLTPNANGYTKTLLDVYGSSFAPERVAARKGYVAVAGNTTGSRTELRLYRITNGVLKALDTKNFFFRYYHDKNPPAGYASASTYNPAYTSLFAVNILDWEGKVYLLYSADGLGDVFELPK